MPGGSGGGTTSDDDGDRDKTNAILRGPLNLPKTPRKIGRKPPLKGTRRETLQDIARRVPVEVMRPYFNYPLRTAADAMCISVTSLKRLCRRHGVKRWPHRQLSGLNRAVTLLEAKREPSRNDPAVAEQLSQLYRRREQIIDLAFMSDDNSSESKGDSFSKLYGEEREKSGDSDTMPDAIESSSTREEAPDRDVAPPPPARFSRNPDETVPWWHREPHAHPWRQRQEQYQQYQHQHTHRQHYHHQHRSGGGAPAREGDAVYGAKAREGWSTGREDQARLSRSLVDGDRRDRRGGAEGSVLYGGTSSVASSGPFQGGRPRPSTHSTAVGATATGSSLEIPPRSTLSKQPRAGGRSSNGVGTTTPARAWDLKPQTGLSSVAPPAHYPQLSLPPSQRHHHHHHRHHHHHVQHDQRGRDSGMESGVARMAGLNNIFSGDASSYRRGGEVEARGGDAASGESRGRLSGKEGGPGDAGQGDIRPLPSIARLVEASAMLSAAGEGEWRYSQDRPQQQQQQQAPFRRAHERAGAL